MRVAFNLLITAVMLGNSGAVHAESLVMVVGAGGTLVRTSSNEGFIKNYASDGSQIVSEPSIDADADVVAADVNAPSAVPRAEVLTAIETVAMRYADSGGLRAAGLSASEWLMFFRANIEIESGYNPQALSPQGAMGLGQLMPSTAKILGVDPTDMTQNLDGSARYLLDLLDRFGSKELALAGYNAGPGAVEEHNGVPPYPETMGHVAKVMAVFNRMNGVNL